MHVKDDLLSFFLGKYPGKVSWENSVNPDSIVMLFKSKKQIGYSKNHYLAEEPFEKGSLLNLFFL